MTPTTSALVAGSVAAACSLVGRHALSIGRARRVERRLGVQSRLDGTPGLPVPPRLLEALDRAGLDVAPDVLWRRWVLGAVAAVGSLTVLLGTAAGAFMALAAWLGPATVLWALRDRGSVRYDAALPGLLDEAAVGLRAGSSMLVALGDASGRAPRRLGADVRALVQSVERGATLASALDRWVADRPSPAVRLTTAALAVGAATGGRQSRALESVAETLRDRQAVRREAAALATQSRASALVMSIIPLVFAAATALLDRRVAHVIIHTPLGIACLFIGLGLDGAAALWMNRITGVAT